MNSIHIVLHGGLGNQLFQLYKAILFSDSYENYQIIIHSELLEKYKTKRNFELKILLNETQKNQILIEPIGILSRFRIPKIIYKLLDKQIIFNFFNKFTIIDGYFQNINDYKCYNQYQLQKIIKSWRHLLIINGYLKNFQTQDELIHLRLGDFYKNEIDAQLSYAKSGTHIITNNEIIVNKAISYLNKKNDLFLIHSNNLESWEVLCLMTGYRNIISNGSSLSFWAATLVGSNFFSTDNNHQMIHSHIYS